MKDPRIEQLFKDGQYKFIYRELIPWEEMDLEASFDNPARLHRPIDEGRVTDYGCKMLDGVVFPGIVCLRRVGQKLLVGGGLHRVRAAKEAKKLGHSGYIVTEEDPYRFDLLIRLLNGIEGQGDTRRDRILHALALHEKYPRCSLSELAKEFDLPSGEVNRAYNEQKSLRRAQALGFDFETSKSSKPSQSALVAMNQIVHEAVFRRACEFVMNYAPKGVEVEEMVKAIRAAKSEAAELKVVDKYIDAAREEAKRRKATRKRAASSQATKLIGQARAINNKIVSGIEQLQLSSYTDPVSASIIFDELVTGAKRVADEFKRIAKLRQIQEAAE